MPFMPFMVKKIFRQFDSRAKRDGLPNGSSETKWSDKARDKARDKGVHTKRQHPKNLISEIREIRG